MTRTIIVAIALLAAAPAFAAELAATHSDTPSIENAGTAEASKPKPKPVKGEASDYLVVTLKEVSITSY